MKKLFGIQAELNITADDDVCKSIGSGIKNGTIDVADLINEAIPIAIKALKKELKIDDEKKTNE